MCTRLVREGGGWDRRLVRAVHVYTCQTHSLPPLQVVCKHNVTHGFCSRAAVMTSSPPTQTSDVTVTGKQLMAAITTRDHHNASIGQEKRNGSRIHV